MTMEDKQKCVMSICNFLHTRNKDISLKVMRHEAEKAVARAESLYDKTKGEEGPYIRTAIRNALYQYCEREHDYLYRHVELNENIHVIDEREKDPGLNLDIETMLNVLSKIDERYKDILTDYYLNNKTLQEIGKSMGITYQRVYQLMQQGLKAMRKAME